MLSRCWSVENRCQIEQRGRYRSRLADRRVFRRSKQRQAFMVEETIRRIEAFTFAVLSTQYTWVGAGLGQESTCDDYRQACA